MAKLLCLINITIGTFQSCCGTPIVAQLLVRAMVGHEHDKCVPVKSILAQIPNDLAHGPGHFIEVVAEKA